MNAALEILESLGCRVQHYGHTIVVDSTVLSANRISREAMARMRSSILFLGPLLARTGEGKVHQPGGCPLGERPVDLHLRGFNALGVETWWEEGRLTCCGKLKGGTCVLSYPSVGATENLIMAALGAEGETTICNAAKEPEIVDLIGFLCASGARISGGGTGTVQITPGPLHGVEYAVMPDRAEAATWLAAAAATGGEVALRGIYPQLLASVLDRYMAAGCVLWKDEDMLAIRAPERLNAVGVIRTGPYPGFPTDAQAPVMASFLRAKGITVFEETVFSDRYHHVPAFRSVGANITTESTLAVVTGVERTHGAQMWATDLRGGAAMVVAALAAEGHSRVFGLEHIRRGYENLTEKLCGLGARIEEVKDEPAGDCQGGSYHEQGSIQASLQQRRSPAE